MSARTTTKWVCERCKATETVEGDDESDNWVRAYYSCPPRGPLEAIGELCNACSGRLVDFVNGTDEEAAKR